MTTTTISKKIITKEQNEKLNKLAKALRSDKVEIDNILPDSDYHIPHSVEWDEVSALSSFDHLNLDPLKEIRDQIDEINSLLKAEYEKDPRNRSDRHIKDLHTIKQRSLLAILPFRHSKINTMVVDTAAENTGVQIVLMAEDSEDDSE